MNLEPAHDEEELQECENWQWEIAHVFFKALSSDQTTQEERVDSYRHNLQHAWNTVLCQKLTNNQ